MYNSLLKCQPLFQELRNLPLNTSPSHRETLRLIAIESVLSEKLPAIYTQSPVDDVDFLFHSTLRALKEQGIIPADSSLHELLTP